MEKWWKLDLEVERSRLNQNFNLQLSSKTWLSWDYNNAHVWLFLRFEILEKTDIQSFNSSIEKIIEKLRKFPYYEEWELFTVKVKDRLTNSDRYILFEEPNIKKLIQEINNIVNELRTLWEKIWSDNELNLEKFLSQYKDVILEKARNIMALIAGEDITDWTAKRVSEIL